MIDAGAARRCVSGRGLLPPRLSSAARMAGSNCWCAPAPSPKTNMPDGLSSSSRQVKASSVERKQSCGESRSVCCGTMKPHGLRWPMEAHAARGISAKMMIRADASASFGWFSLQVLASRLPAATGRKKAAWGPCRTRHGLIPQAASRFTIEKRQRRIVNPAERKA